MIVHLIWASALVLCFVVCIIPQIIERFHLKPTEEKYMTRREFTSLNGRAEQAIIDRKYQDTALKIEIDELHKYLRIRRAYKDGVMYLVHDIQSAEYLNGDRYGSD